MDDEKKTIRVKRRRRTKPTSSEGRRRAETPRRRRSDDRDSAAPPRVPDGTGGGGGLSSLARLPSRGSSGGGCGPGLWIIILLAIVFICILAVFVFMSPGDVGDLTSSYSPPTPESLESFDSFTEDLPTVTPEPFTPPVTSSDGQTWLVMLYQDADDKVLEQDIYVDLNEAERVGSSDRVHIVAEVDRYRAGYRGDGNWSTTRVFYVTRDDDLEQVRSQLVADLGEANMSDGDTLVDFATWAIDSFPADKHVLILSDHGLGWPGGWSDPEPRGEADPSVPLSSAMGDQLYLMEMDDALQEIRDRTDLDKFELIGLDACLMGQLEVFSALAPHARYAVASQETEPALGWAYTSFLEKLVQYPDMDGADLGKLIVDSYIESDQRIVDDQARAELLRSGSPMGGLFDYFGPVTADQLAQRMGKSSTLTAVDLSAIPGLMNSLNDLSFALQEEQQRLVAGARTYAQSFTSIFGRSVPPSYIDLGNFAQLLRRETSNSSVAQAADQMQAALNEAVVAEKHGPSKPGATGISIYFPNSQLYRSAVAGPQSYTIVARRFADQSLWDDFLAYHYTGRTFDPATGALAVPERGTTISAPGYGEIEISSITLSDSVAAPGQPVILSADISGQNVGYAFLFVGYYDKEFNSILMADTDYLESYDTREVGGVYYPDWGEDGGFTMEFEWEPIVYAIYDGVDFTTALFTPERYGASPEEAVYTVDGIYTYDDGESRYSRLYFSDGILRQVLGFTGEDGTGAPREIIPQSGDTFTILEKWMDLDQSGNVEQVASQEGGTLTFGDQLFTWEEMDAAPGEYIVGFIVEDLDGNSYEVYEQVLVE